MPVPGSKRKFCGARSAWIIPTSPSAERDRSNSDNMPTAARVNSGSWASIFANPSCITGSKRQSRRQPSYGLRNVNDAECCSARVLPHDRKRSSLHAASDGATCSPGARRNSRQLSQWPALSMMGPAWRPTRQTRKGAPGKRPRLRHLQRCAMPGRSSVGNRCHRRSRPQRRRWPRSPVQPAPLVDELTSAPAQRKLQWHLITQE